MTHYRRGAPLLSPRPGIPHDASCKAPMTGARRRVPPAFPAALPQRGDPRHRRDEAPRASRPTASTADRAASGAGGLDSPKIRATMVERLRAGGVRHVRVLDAMAAVPRHLFIDSGLAAQAYEDTSLPIGHGQTISKPSVVARMIELLFEGKNARRQGHLGRVLEIGTGCGYQAAILARLSRGVYSVERLKPLHDLAREKLAPVRSVRGHGDIRLVYGDGRLGHSPNAPYDSIIAAAGGDDVPTPWLEQLAYGGRLVAPLQGDAEGLHRLVVVDRDERGWHRSMHEAVRFVPLKSGLA